uniref:SANT domain-containing protein n=1 Tax=Acrobeloides nanus TaxID=290746 RepID=A0A914BYV3_9BILA
MISIIPKDHPDCFFEPRLEKLRETIEWSSDETLECVQGFHKFGKDFEKIAEQIDGKTPEMISEFYELHKARYRLDFLISLYEREQVGETYARNSRNINACDDDDEFDGDNRARESRSNAQRRDFSKSSMITRNQKKRTVDVEY